LKWKSFLFFLIKRLKHKARPEVFTEGYARKEKDKKKKEERGSGIKIEENLK